jgi:Domain of unknown function (DUF4279)
VRIRQYVYFAATSNVLPVSDLTARLGVESDGFSVRGSKMANPPVPRAHMWQIRCDDPGLAVGEQIARVIARLAPYRERITNLGRELAGQDPPGSLRLQVVRYFDDEEGEDENEREWVDAEGNAWERMSGQHQLLGWHLDSDVLSFLHSVGAEVDIDEYG